MSEPSSNLRDELHPLLIARVRLGVALVGTSIVLFSLLELWQQRAPLGPFVIIKAVQVTVLGAVWFLLDATAPARRTIGLALVLVTEVAITLAASGILANEVASSPLLFVLLTLGTGILLPWGLRPQLATVAILAAALVVNAWWVQPLPDGFGYTVIAACLAFIASLCMVREIELHRMERHRAERDERESTSALREEIFVTETAAHAARELLAGVDAQQVLGTLCKLETCWLRCEASYAFLRDAQDTKAFVAVAGDGDTSAEWMSRRTLRIPDIGLARLLDRLDRDEGVVLTDSTGVLPVEGRAGIYTPLVAGRDLIGIQVAVRRRDEAFSPTEVELARRLARTASAALAQVRLREAPFCGGGTAFGARVWRELQTPLSSILRLAERAGDLSLPSSERRALALRIASVSRDVLRFLEHLDDGDRVRPSDGAARRG